MSAWQACNYLGRLLYPFKILAQHKLSVSPVEIPRCSMSYGKLTFIVRRTIAKAAQGRTRLSSLTPCHLPYSEGVPQPHCIITHSQESWTLATCFVSISAGPPFPPGTTARCLSSAPYRGPRFHSVRFWDQSWGLWQSHCLLGSTFQLGVAEAKGFPIAEAGLLEHRAAGTQEVTVCLAALPPAWRSTMNKWCPFWCWVSWRAKWGWLFLGREICEL